MSLTQAKIFFAQLGIRQNRLLETIANQVLAHGDVTLADTVQLYHAMASLDYTHAPFQAHLAKIISQAEPKDFGIQQLANCAWSAAVLQETDENVHTALKAALEASQTNILSSKLILHADSCSCFHLTYHTMFCDL
jgi:hypothetical protein